MTAMLSSAQARALTGCIALVFLMLSGPSFAAGASRYAPIVGQSAVQDANFYLLTLLEEDAPAAAALSQSDGLRALAETLQARTGAAAKACERAIAERSAGAAGSASDQAACDLNALRWTAEETDAAAAAAGAAFDANEAVRSLVADHMRPSRYFSLYEDLDDRTLFLSAWRDAHGNIDRIIRVYGLGEPPRSEDIDSVIYPIDGGYYRGLLASLIREVAMANAGGDPSWSSPKRLALELIEANKRDDAVRQLALEESENAATARRMAKIDWRKYAYSAILVPGHSPEIEYEPLNPNAKLRIRRGVERFRAGEAPVIIVSGGTLRPIGTSFNEALEMKRHLVSEHGVPEDAILIDPVARHTTTNMRNTVRLIAKYGAPFDKKALVVGNSVPYIASDRFRERCLRELGYMPFAPGERLDFEALEFTPVAASHHRDASEPMDP